MAYESTKQTFGLSGGATGGSSLSLTVMAVLGEPYSGIQTTTILDGNKIVLKHTIRFFRDSYGRTRIERMVPTNSDVQSSAIFMSVTISDPVTAEEYTLQPQERTAVVSHLPPSEVARIQPPVTPPIPTGLPPWGLPGVQESKPVSLGEKFIYGIEVVGTRVEQTVSFEDREPDPALFVLPPEYTRSEVPALTSSPGPSSSPAHDESAKDL